MPVFFYVVGGVALILAFAVAPTEHHWIFLLGASIFFGLVSIASALYPKE